VVVGDSAQLPPFGASGGRAVTSSFDAFDEAGGTLVLQRRIPSPIATILSEVLYEGKLLTSPEKLIAPSECSYGINVNGTETTHELSKYNIQETELIYSCLYAIKQRGLDLPTVVPTFYTSQVLKLRALLKDFDVEIVTVDDYQGREKDMVFLFLVRTMFVGFLSDIRRVNVALSRVRKQLWVVGALDFWKDQATAAPALSSVAQLCIKKELT
jgi:superfamily I DNA and/or RNA helicase